MKTYEQRIQELSELEDGWFDGEGYAPTEESLKTARYLSSFLVEGKFSFFPTETGGILVECKETDLPIEFMIYSDGVISS